MTDYKKIVNVNIRISVDFCSYFINKSYYEILLMPFHYLHYDSYIDFLIKFFFKVYLSINNKLNDEFLLPESKLYIFAIQSHFWPF